MRGYTWDAGNRSGCRTTKDSRSSMTRCAWRSVATSPFPFSAQAQAPQRPRDSILTGFLAGLLLERLGPLHQRRVGLRVHERADRRVILRPQTTAAPAHRIGLQVSLHALPPHQANHRCRADLEYLRCFSPGDAGIDGLERTFAEVLGQEARHLHLSIIQLARFFLVIHSIAIACQKEPGPWWFCCRDRPRNAYACRAGLQPGGTPTHNALSGEPCRRRSPPCSARAPSP